MTILIAESIRRKRLINLEKEVDGYDGKYQNQENMPVEAR